MRNLLAPAALFFVIAIWASAFVGIRYSLTAYHPGSLALLRYLIASVFMLIIYKQPFVKKSKVKLADLPVIVLCGISGIALYNIALNTSETAVSASVASFIVAQVPVLITILAIIFLKESAKLTIWLGMLASIIGTSLIALSHPLGSSFYHWGIVAAIAAALFSALYSIIQVPVLRRLHPIQFTSYAIWSGTIVLLVYSPQLFSDLHHVTLGPTLTIVYLGIFPAALGYLVWSYALTRIPASKAASALYLSPIIATLLGWWLLNETPHLLEISGGLISLIGAYAVNKKRRQKLSQQTLSQEKK